MSTPTPGTRMETIENARLDDVRTGDHLTWTRVQKRGDMIITTHREGVAHHRDASGVWRTQAGAAIAAGEGAGVTLTIRRTVRDLPPEPGTIIVPADGCQYITATIGGQTYRAREARLSTDRWWAVWRTADGQRVCYSVRREEINTGTWKVDDE